MKKLLVGGETGRGRFYKIFTTEAVFEHPYVLPMRRCRTTGLVERLAEDKNLIFETYEQGDNFASYFNTDF
jgi:hypothetical protein